VLIIGGAMANTLLLAQGIGVGKSLAEHDMVDTAREFLAQAKKQNKPVLLPTDAVVAGALEPGTATQTVAIGKVPAEQMILDVGPDTVAAIEARLAQCRTLVWNGPVGAFETKPFDRGTVALAKAVARLTKAGKLVSVAGGGDTVAALEAAGVTGDLTYVSAAGGAFLEWLEGRTLPGIAALEHR
jgi:phosphoglycerate kinase